MSGDAAKEGLAEYEASFQATSRRQARRGLAMTHAERMRWLVETQAELLGLLGRARLATRHR